MVPRATASGFALEIIEPLLVDDKNTLPITFELYTSGLISVTWTCTGSSGVLSTVTVDAIVIGASVTIVTVLSPIISTGSGLLELTSAKFELNNVTPPSV